MKYLITVNPTGMFQNEDGGPIVESVVNAHEETADTLKEAMRIAESFKSYKLKDNADYNGDPLKYVIEIWSLVEQIVG